LDVWDRVRSMDESLIEILQRELRIQCSFVVRGAVQVNAGLKEMDVDGVWFALQGILIAASNASKLLWGTNAKVKAARASLRESVQVDDDSPLNDRRVRNSFDHIDQRITKWFGQKGSERVYVGRNIGAPESVKIDGEPPADPFGQFDPKASELTFWEESIELQAIVVEAERTIDAIDRALAERSGSG
jgi:hypothetical protein